jgi:hypothetical protein
MRWINRMPGRRNKEPADGRQFGLDFLQADIELAVHDLPIGSPNRCKVVACQEMHARWVAGPNTL